MKLAFRFAWVPTFPKPSNVSVFTWGTVSAKTLSRGQLASVGLCISFDLSTLTLSRVRQGCSMMVTLPTPPHHNLCLCQQGPRPLHLQPTLPPAPPLDPVRVGKCLFSLLNLTNTNSVSFISEDLALNPLCAPTVQTRAAVVFVRVFVHTLPPIRSWTNI